MALSFHAYLCTPALCCPISAERRLAVAYRAPVSHDMYILTLACTYKLGNDLTPRKNWAEHTSSPMPVPQGRWLATEVRIVHFAHGRQELQPRASVRCAASRPLPLPGPAQLHFLPHLITSIAALMHRASLAAHLIALRCYCEGAVETADCSAVRCVVVCGSCDWHAVPP